MAGSWFSVHRSAASRLSQPFEQSASRGALLRQGGSAPPLDDTVAQKRALKAPFGDVGGRFRTLVAELDGADDLYASEMAQVRMRKWSDRRIVLAGDAAYCPSPLTGQGTSLALVGAYLLAEEMARSGDDLAAPAEGHERRLRPFVEANLVIDLHTKNAIAI